MRIQRLSLTNYRNFIRLETEFPAGAILLIGRNAQGKTSLLEAVHYLSTGNSPHASSDRELINFLALDDIEPFSRIVAEIDRPDRLTRLEIRILLENGSSSAARIRKEVYINGVRRPVADLGTAFNSVTFLPQDLQIIEGSPRHRRKMIDDLISQANPIYAQALTDYGKALSQRNALLKQIQDRRAGLTQLQVWTEPLADHGAAIIRARALSIGELEALAQPLHRQLTDGAEDLRLEYLPSYHPGSHVSAQLELALDTGTDWRIFSLDQIREGLLETWQTEEQDDLQRGVTQTGPHRDELRYLANSLDLRLYGSRGQIRSAMLATRLAEVSWLNNRIGTWPVLLLDEVLAELDQQRRADLLDRVLESEQALLTTTDQDLFSETFLEQAALWEVEAGALQRLARSG